MPAVIHITSESLYDGSLSQRQESDLLCLDANNGSLCVKTDISHRALFHPNLAHDHVAQIESLSQADYF